MPSANLLKSSDTDRLITASHDSGVKTALSTYQVVSIPLTEISTSVHLTQLLLPQFNQSLRQTEALLAISGKREIKERLEYFLLFL